MNNLIIKIAATEVLTNHELLRLIKIDELSEDKLQRIFPGKFWKIINHSNYLNFDQLNIHAINFLDNLYPDKLREIYNPPAVLFYEGKIELLNRTGIGIVGARIGTNYSRVAIETVCSHLSTDKVIVSGMANGVDSMGHVSALKYGLGTIAVMGTGIDDCYPKNSLYLKRKIIESGLVISEYPPNHITKPYNFVQRNRIIAGLSESLIVTEAKKKSGSLITANLALENNRNVYALPGEVGSALSVGTNELIRDGANILLF